MTTLSKYLATIGSKGGSAKSAAKRKSAQKNGERGGRPRRFKTIQEAAELAASLGKAITGVLPSKKKVRVDGKGTVEFIR